MTSPADTSPAPRNEPHRAPKHGLAEDAQAIAFGALICSFGLTLLTHLGFVTGQTAGLAVLISYATGWGFGAVFFVVNLPFYVLALWRMGLRFTIKTVAAVALVSLLATKLPDLIQFDQVDPALGAILIGAVSGAGLLALFRHGASLGGVGVLALFLEEKTGFRAGYTQILFDVCVFGAAIFVIDWQPLLWSLLGAMVLNFTIAINHHRDRYIAT